MYYFFSTYSFHLLPILTTTASVPVLQCDSDKLASRVYWIVGFLAVRTFKKSFAFTNQSLEVLLKTIGKIY